MKIKKCPKCQNTMNQEYFGSNYVCGNCGYKDEQKKLK